jgi:AAHS family 4-hydroxybenzoate transporter-like MFS transporter
LLAAHGWRGTFVVFGLATLVLILLVIAILRDSLPFLAARGQHRI